MDLIQSTVCAQSQESVLDLREFPIARDRPESLTSILEKLLDKTASIESDLSGMKVGALPIAEICAAVEVVTRHKDNCVAQQRHLDLEVGPSLEQVFVN